MTVSERVMLGISLIGSVNHHRKHARYLHLVRIERA